MPTAQDFQHSRARLIQLDSEHTIVYLSEGARRLGLEVGTDWPHGTGSTCTIGEDDFLITADPSGEGGLLLALSPLQAQQKLYGALQSITHCCLDGLPAIDGKLGNALLRAVATLNEALKQSLDSAHQLKSEADGMSTSAEQLSDRTTSVAAQLEETLSTTRQLDDTVQSNLQATESLAEGTRRIDCDIQRGREALNNTAQQMQDISERVKETQRIVEAIDQIAFNTNILALNAAVEAARAGDSGRGFSVVAQEVRSLAGHASDQANEIRDLLHRVHNSSSAGQKVVSEVQDSLENLFGGLQQITRRVEDIRETSNEQAQGMRECTQTLEVISTLNEQNASLAEELSSIAGNFRANTGYMLDSLEVFNLQQGFSHPKHKAVYNIAHRAAQQIGAAMEAAIKRGEISEQDLFDRNHQKVPNTNPTRYNTRFDQFCDRLLPPIQEAALQESGFLIYLIATDDCGYVPTHNDRFCKPLTGDPAVDLAGNRTKRIFADRVGQSSGTHEKDYLLLTYRRDTGEVLSDLSCPIYVNGRHWGGVRAGYNL